MEYGRSRIPPTSETVGNGLCAVPGTPRKQPVRMNGITRVGAAIMPPATLRLQPVGLNGIAHQRVRRGGNLVARHVSTITCADEWYRIPTCHSERANASRGIFPSGKFYFVLFFCPTWWIPPLRLRCGRNDKPEGCFCLPTQVVFATFPGTAHRPFPTVSLMGGSIQPHRLYSERGGRQIAAPTDTPVGDTIHPHGFYSQRPPERHTGRSLRFR